MFVYSVLQIYLAHCVQDGNIFAQTRVLLLGCGHDAWTGPWCGIRVNWKVSRQQCNISATGRFFGVMMQQCGAKAIAWAINTSEDELLQFWLWCKSLTNYIKVHWWWTIGSSVVQHGTLRAIALLCALLVVTVQPLLMMRNTLWSVVQDVVREPWAIAMCNSDDSTVQPRSSYTSDDAQ